VVIKLFEIPIETSQMPLYTVNRRDRALYIGTAADKPADLDGHVEPGSLFFESDTAKVYIYTGNANNGWVDITTVAAAGVLAADSRG
jgi:hypothetical protein